MESLQNKRDMYRVELIKEMCGQLSVDNLNVSNGESGLYNIGILDISAVGICFRCKLNLPTENLVYKVHFKVFNFTYSFKGILKWKKSEEAGKYLYGLQLEVSEEEKNELIKVITWISVKSKSSLDGVYNFCEKRC